MRLAVLAWALLLGSCAGMEPFDPPVAGELNPEPGLFSGPDGAFVLFQRQLTPTAAEPPERRLTAPPPP